MKTLCTRDEGCRNLSTEILKAVVVRGNQNFIQSLGVYPFLIR